MNELQITDGELEALFGADAPGLVDATPGEGTVESVIDPALAPVATSWPCVIAATIGAQC